MPSSPSRFRECAARALLLPRRDPGRRSPLWQQRQRAAQLLEVVPVPVLPDRPRGRARVPPGRLRPAGPGRADARVDRREVRVVDVDHPALAVRPQPAVRLRRPVRLRGRLAHRRAPGRRAQPRPGPARRAARPRRAARAARPRGAGRGGGRAAAAGSRPQARDAEGVVDLLRLLGPLSTDEVAARAVPTGPTSRRWLAPHRRPPGGPGPDGRRRAVGRGRGRRPAARRARRAGAARHARRLRRAGRRPARRPGRALRPHPRPLHRRRPRDPARSRRRRRPPDAPAPGRPGPRARRRVPARRAPGPSGATPRCCARLRRRSLARLRQEIEPVEPQALARFLRCSVADASPSGRRGLRGVDGVLTASTSSPAARCRRRALEPLVLAARVRDYEPALLDELTAAGEVMWAGHGALPGNDGWVSLHLADQAPLTLPDRRPFEHSELHQAVLDALAPGGAWFFRQLSDQVAGAPTTEPSRRRCGTSSGPAGSATTRSPRCAP